MNNNKVFPLRFTLERVENGYVLTSKKASGSPGKDASYSKEVVMDEKINSRIGQLLRLDTMPTEQQIVFYVEAVSEGIYKTDVEIDTDGLMEAKLAFAHFNNKTPSESILALQFSDTNCLEIYGEDADKVAKQNNLSVARSGGIPFLRFPNTKDGKRNLATLTNGKLALMEVSSDTVKKWYASRQVELNK